MPKTFRHSSTKCNSGGPAASNGRVVVRQLAPDSHTARSEDLSIALLLTLDPLSPLKRAAFLLHDVFDCSNMDDPGSHHFHLASGSVRSTF